MKEIVLTQNKVALVDAEDYFRLNLWSWYYNNGYAKHTISSLAGSRVVLMHRLIMDCPIDQEVDHINHNKLDNRKENLRICSIAQNRQNRPRPIKNKSGYKGVLWIDKMRKWQAQISVNNRTLSLGFFDTKEAAAYAYDVAAVRHYGEFATLNNAVYSLV